MKTFILAVVILASTVCFGQKQQWRATRTADLRSRCLSYDRVSYDYNRLLERYRFGHRVQDGGVVHDISEVTDAMFCAGYFEAVFLNMHGKLFVGADGVSIVLGDWKEGVTPDDLMSEFERHFDAHPMEFVRMSVDDVVLRASVDRHLYNYTPFKPDTKGAK